ncbi:MAG: PRC-barrel domain containing protein [Alphaproteobacteria bacterium]|nr:PRC-barrel domain containing protein [Alphaproteobacteria bacterium]
MLNSVSKLTFALLLVAAPTSLGAQSTEPTLPPVAETQAKDDAQTPAKPLHGQITTQSKNTVLASNLIGAAVKSPDETAIGEINDVIVTVDGAVEGVVIGVGGFLGLGEKDVAVELGAIALETTEGGRATFILNATKEDLEAAPPFKTAEQQLAEKRLDELSKQQEQNTLTQGFTPPASSSTQDQ